MSGVPDALRFAFDLVEDAVVILERGDDDRIAWANRAFVDASLYLLDEVIGRRLTALQAPRVDGERADLRWVRRRDGGWYRVERRRATVPGGDPAAPVVIEVQRAIDGHAGDERYRLIAENSRDIISIVDGRGVCKYVSPSVREILGYEPAELIGVAGPAIAHPEDVALVHSTLARNLASAGDGADTSITSRVRHKDGSWVWLERTTRAIRDATGAVVEFHSSSREVGARVRAEEALARSQQDMHRLLAAMPEAGCVHRDGRFVYVNHAFGQMVRREPAEMVGTMLVDFVHPRHREAVARRIAPGRRDYSRSDAYSVIRADGAEIPIEVVALPMVYDGQLADLALLRDLSEKRRLEAELALSERLASIGRLAAAVGHEINNPLTYMIGSLALLRVEIDRLADPLDDTRLAGAREHLDRLQDGAERVRDIVRDLRSLTAIPRGEVSPVDIHRVLDRAAATAQHEIRLRARLVKDYGPVGKVLGEELRLVQVFINLLVNAAQSIPEGRVTDHEIRMSTRAAGDTVVIEVSDTGGGLPGGAVERVFEPFFTTKPASVGTGLGLSICHQLVTSFGGTITAAPGASRGAVFRVTLPASDRVPVPVPVPVPAPVPVASVAPPLRILLVDDEPYVTRALALLLAPHEVVVASGTSAAIAQLDRDARFDAILCDLQMGDGSGVDVYEHVRARLPMLQPRMVFMTGGAFTDRAREFLSTCAQPCLTKPFSTTQLLATIEEIAAQAATPPPPSLPSS